MNPNEYLPRNVASPAIVCVTIFLEICEKCEFSSWPTVTVLCPSRDDILVKITENFAVCKMPNLFFASTVCKPLFQGTFIQFERKYMETFWSVKCLNCLQFCFISGKRSVCLHCESAFVVDSACFSCRCCSVVIFETWVRVHHLFSSESSDHLLSKCYVEQWFLVFYCDERMSC